MPESPVIAALAKQARDGLDADVGEAPRVHEKFCEKALYGDPYGDAPCDCGWPTRILADVAARRTLLDKALGWKHGYATKTTQGAIYCAVIDSPDSGYDCDCGRDERVRAVLTALATPYQEADRG